MIVVAAVTLVEIDEPETADPQRVKDAVDATVPGLLIAVMSATECHLMLNTHIEALQKLGRLDRLPALGTVVH